MNYETFEGIEQIPFNQFVDGEIEVYEGERTKYYQIHEAGIIGLHCLPTNRTYITEGPHISLRIFNLTQDLWSVFINSDKLREDFEIYHNSGFIILILARGEEWLDQKKREQEVERLKKIWPHELYIGENML